MTAQHGQASVVQAVSGRLACGITTGNTEQREGGPHD